MIENCRGHCNSYIKQHITGKDKQSSELKKHWFTVYNMARKAIADISAILRSVNTVKVAIPAFCDILLMYARTECYFTQSEVYKKCKSGTVIIRNCDVRHPEGANMD